MSSGTTARDLLLPLALAAAGALGAIPGTHSGADPVAMLAWISVLSAAAGYSCGAEAVRPWPIAALAPGAWMGIVAIVDGLSPRDLPSPAWAALAWSGLFAGGLGLGRLSKPGATSGSGIAGASVLFLLAAL